MQCFPSIITADTTDPKTTSSNGTTAIWNTAFSNEIKSYLIVLEEAIMPEELMKGAKENNFTFHDFLSIINVQLDKYQYKFNWDEISSNKYMLDLQYKRMKAYPNHEQFYFEIIPASEQVIFYKQIINDTLSDSNKRGASYEGVYSGFIGRPRQQLYEPIQDVRK